MTVKRKKEISEFVNRHKRKVPTIAELLDWYETEHGSYSNEPLWRIGYLCAMRDADRLTWGEWSALVDLERRKM